MPYSVKHIDISNSLNSLSEIFSGKNQYLVFWCKQIPLGHLYTDEIIAPLSEIEYRRMIWNKIFETVTHYNSDKKNEISFLEKSFMDGDIEFTDLLLKKKLEKKSNALPTVSLIICTHNRANNLEKCLTALKQLSYSPDEIIVVDNAPHDNAAENIVKKFNNVKYVCEKRKGLNHARNCGIRNAQSEIIAFTDDDVELHEDWIWRILENFSDERIQAVTGLVFAKELDTEAQVLFEKHWGFNRGYMAKFFDDIFYSANVETGIPVTTIGAGASMAFRKNIFYALGFFDVRLDMGAAGCNGDSEMWYRILAEGWKIKYDPLTISYHTHRKETSALRKQIRQYMRGFVTAAFIQYKRYKNKGELNYIYKHLPKYYFKKIFCGTKKQRATLLDEIAGFISGFFYFRNVSRDQPFETIFNNDIPHKNIPDAKPLVSIVITTYNHARYLPDSVGSVFSQTYSNIELIVVDDGSVDNTREVIKKLGEIKYVYQQNKGLAVARNTGIANCKGQFIVFLDADDWLYPHAVEVNLAHFHANPHAAFVSGWYDMVNTKKEILMTYLLMPPKNNYYPALLKNNYIGMHATVMYRKKVFDFFLFDSHLKACEDYDLYLRIARLFKISSHHEKITAYRMHDNNMSNNILLMVNNVKKVLQKHYATLPVVKDYPLYKEGLRNWKQYYADEILLRLQYRTKYPWYKPNTKDTLFAFFTLPFRSLKLVVKMSIAGIKKSIKYILPAPLKRFFYKRGWIYNYIPKSGRVKLGDLKRTSPLSKEFGYDRGGPVDRYYIEKFLNNNKSYICGNVLEIGDNTYTMRFGEKKVLKSDILYIDDSNPNATIIGDLSDLPQVQDEQFDCIILTQTLHLIYDYKTALKNCFRMLKKNGVLLMTVPGITNIDYGEWEKTWYWSFTGRSVQLMLEENFKSEKIKVQTFGNVETATAFLYGLGSTEISNTEKDFHDTHYQVIVASVSIKD